MFEKIKNTQPNVIRLLNNSFKKDRLSHAYLFEGERGTKKFETALYFAQMLLCTSDVKPCGTCHNCKRIDHYTHPNVYIVEATKNQIKKKQILDLQAEFSKTSLEKGAKVFIIKDIETIRVEAANSLLKFLEEPHPNTFGILTTSNINRILPTIISRSQVVTFHSLNKRLIAEELIDLGFNEMNSKIVSQITNSVDDALEILNSDSFIPLLSFVIEIMNVISANEESIILYFNENNSIIFEDNNTYIFLSLLIMYQKDIINVRIKNKNSIMFSEELTTLENIATYKDTERLIKELEDMLSLLSRLSFSINRSLAFDNLLLELERR